jgi:hypothetical protein
VTEERALGIDDLMGQFRGTGTWRDSAGATGGYDAFLGIRGIGDRFEVKQRHVLDDGTGSELTFTLEPVAPFIYRVEATVLERGFGFVMNDLVRFCFDNHIGSITEIGYQAKKPDALVAYGFTDRNSDGNYIMWHEQLARNTDAV